MVPEFVNPKYATPAKDVFKSPTRLECMMQDFPKLLPSVIRTNACWGSDCVAEADGL